MPSYRAVNLSNKSYSKPGKPQGIGSVIEKEQTNQRLIDLNNLAHHCQFNCQGATWQRNMAACPRALLRGAFERISGQRAGEGAVNAKSYILQNFNKFHQA